MKFELEMCVGCKHKNYCVRHKQHCLKYDILLEAINASEAKEGDK